MSECLVFVSKPLNLISCVIFVFIFFSKKNFVAWWKIRLLDTIVKSVKETRNANINSVRNIALSNDLPTNVVQFVYVQSNNKKMQVMDVLKLLKQAAYFAIS